MKDPETKERIREAFARFIKSRKMRQTPERFAILDKALDQHVHFDIEGLYGDIRKDCLVSLSTVYRTVELLCECGLFRKHFIRENQAVYEFAENRHLHLICLECGEMREVRDEGSSEVLDGLRFRGFHPSFITVNIYGLCSKCNLRMKQKRQKWKPEKESKKTKTKNRNRNSKHKP